MPTESTPWWQSKITLWILGLLLASLSTAGGFLFNRVKSLQTEKTQAVQAKEMAEEASRSAQAKVLQLEQSKRGAETKYRKLLAATNPLTGEPLFDRQGHPIFNTEDGSVHEWEEMQKTLESTLTENSTLKVRVQELSESLTANLSKTSRPARSPWDYGVGYSAPLGHWLSLPSSTLWAGAGYHLDFMGMDVGPKLQAGFSPGQLDELSEAVHVKIWVDLRP